MERAQIGTVLRERSDLKVLKSLLERPSIVSHRAALMLIGNLFSPDILELQASYGKILDLAMHVVFSHPNILHILQVMC